MPTSPSVNSLHTPTKSLPYYTCPTCTKKKPLKCESAIMTSDSVYQSISGKGYGNLCTGYCVPATCVPVYLCTCVLVYCVLCTVYCVLVYCVLVLCTCVLCTCVLCTVYLCTVYLCTCVLVYLCTGYLCIQTCVPATAKKYMSAVAVFELKSISKMHTSTKTEPSKSLSANTTIISIDQSVSADDGNHLIMINTQSHTRVTANANKFI